MLWDQLYLVHGPIVMAKYSWSPRGIYIDEVSKGQEEGLAEINGRGPSYTVGLLNRGKLCRKIVHLQKDV